MEKHDPMCSINISCAVYHENGICPDAGKCNCRFKTHQNKKEEKSICCGCTRKNCGNCGEPFIPAPTEKKESVCGMCKQPYRGGSICPHIAPTSEEEKSGQFQTAIGHCGGYVADLGEEEKPEVISFADEFTGVVLEIAEEEQQFTEEDFIKPEDFSPPTATKSEDSWQEEFDKLLAPDGDTINQILEYRGIWDCGKCFKEDEEERYIKPIKSFILSRIKAAHHEERQKIREMIEKLRLEVLPTHAEENGYECALDDLLANIESNE